MKKIIIITSLFLSVIVNAQNTFPTNGNVGIGTTSPQSILDINGSAPIFRGNGGYIPTGLRFIDDSYTQQGQVKEWAIWKGNNWAKGLAFMRYDAINRCAGGICDVSFFLADNGNIGIGTTTPLSKLDLGNDYSDPSITPNKISLWNGGNNNYMGFGVSESDLDYFSQSNHRFYTGYNGNIGKESMVISGNGNVGIGTTVPSERLNVIGNIVTGNADGTNGSVFLGNASHGLRRTSNKVEIYTNGGDGDLIFSTLYNQEKMRIAANGNVGIGTTNPGAKLEINGNMMTSLGSGGKITLFDNNNNRNNRIELFADDFGANINSTYSSGGTGAINFNTTGIKRMTIVDNGNIGIGTSNPQTKLDVIGKSSFSDNMKINAKLEAKEIKVTISPTADFVFEEDYNLPKLEDIEKHIKEKKHLPEIASAKEMEKEGVNVGEFQIKLLQKIEELTLYTIEQNKKLEEQNKRILDLEKQIKKAKN